MNEFMSKAPKCNYFSRSLYNIKILKNDFKVTPEKKNSNGQSFFLMFLFYQVWNREYKKW